MCMTGMHLIGVPSQIMPYTYVGELLKCIQYGMRISAIDSIGTLSQTMPAC